MAGAGDCSLGRVRLTCLVALAAGVLLPGLGSSGRLTYHEAFVAQGPREILSSGNWVHPTIGSLPWLEKPPLPWWLVATLGYCTGAVNETVARFPSALAAIGLVVGVATLAAHHYGANIGLLAGAVQATTAWTVIRGRLAEADILLACLIVWAIVAFDRLLSTQADTVSNDIYILSRRWRWAFLLFLSSSALVKGIGFGMVLILVVVVGIVVWQRDGRALRQVWAPYTWALAIMLSLAWPIFILAQYGEAALSLWKMHIWARIIPPTGLGTFAGESSTEYITGLLGQALPWTPLAFIGAWDSLSRAVRRGYGWSGGCSPITSANMIAGDRLLWVWAALPLSLLALVPVKNAHYVISAQIPWSIWAALALVRLGTLLSINGYNRQALLRAAQLSFIGLGLTYGLGLWVFGPWLGRRGMEWAFYEAVGQRVPPSMHLALFYDDWDRNPYSTPFGSIPHDLAVRLFYLGRPVCWHIGRGESWPTNHNLGRCSLGPIRLQAQCLSVSTSVGSFAVIGRERDLAELQQFGHVEVVLRGPNIRHDRTYVLFYIVPKLKEAIAKQ